MDILITLPDWLETELAFYPEIIPNSEDRMRMMIRFSQLNFQNGTGGPFAAGVFERDSGRLIAVGVNRVVPTHYSTAHAEVVALSLAQKKLQHFDLGGEDMPEHELVVNCQPCVMCYGAVLWSGVRSLVFAGSGADLETLTGFDEGPMHPHWMEELSKRGITVKQQVLRKEACDVFRLFAKSNHRVYNARQGKEKI